MRLYTIGFTKKEANRFFGMLRDTGATALVDTRLKNVSQLAGFAKRDDLEFFVRELCGMTYRHELRLAPTAEHLRAYQRGELSGDRYAETYLTLIRDRRVEAVLTPVAIEDASPAR